MLPGGEGAGGLPAGGFPRAPGGGPRPASSRGDPAAGTEGRLDSRQQLRLRQWGAQHAEKSQREGSGPSGPGWLCRPRDGHLAGVAGLDEAVPRGVTAAGD